MSVSVSVSVAVSVSVSAPVSVSVSVSVSVVVYTSDAADDLRCVDLGGRRIIKKKKNITFYLKHSTVHNH